MPQRLSSKAVRESIARRAPRPVKAMQIARELGLPAARSKDIRKILETLAERGVIESVAGHRYRLRESDAPSGATPRGATPRAREPRRGAALARGECRGWISLHPRGFGFVSTDDGGADVFVPPSKLETAMHGDFVRVRARPAERGREGQVREVLERGMRRVAGRLIRERGRTRLEPEDVRVPRPIEVVGALPLGISTGDSVVAIIEKYPRSVGDGLRVRVLGELRPRGSAASEIERIELREGIEEEFEAAALDEAQAFGTRVPHAELERREDLRSLGLVTIDPSDARDHDDAVHAERLPRGGFRVTVAIADVSHYVPERSALDRAAAARGTSIYLPDRVIPMLPFELSSNLASLVPGETRLALALEVEVGRRGAIRKHRYVEAAVKSHARLSYEGVAHALGLSTACASQPEAQEKRALLETLWDVSQVLRARRRRRGSLEFDLPEPVVVLDDERNPVDIRRARSDPGVRKAYGMIEDLMLLANEVIAADLERRGLPAIYRVHAPPDAERIERFAKLAGSLGHALEPDASEDPAELAKLLREVEGTAHAAALHFLLLRAMQQATYHTHNVGHFALAAASYLHFTSPIRRYPDLAVHRVVRAVIRKQPIDVEALQGVLQTQAARSSRLERRAQAVDREVARLYGALLLRDRIGETFEARITSLDATGLWLTLSTPHVEVRCPVERLGGGSYALDPLGLHLRARRSGHTFTLGDAVDVVVDAVSIEERTVIVHLADLEPSKGDRGERRGPRERTRSRRSQRSEPDRSRDQERPGRRKIRRDPRRRRRQ